MARSVGKIFKTNYGVAITGIAGPSGGSKLKPVGLVCIAIADGKKVRCTKNRFFGTRTEIKSRAASTALNLLRVHLL